MLRQNPNDPENFDKSGIKPGYQAPTTPAYALTEDKYAKELELEADVSREEAKKEVATPEEEARKAKFEETVDLIEFKYGDRVFEDGIVDSVLDDYAPKDQEGYVLSREEGEQIQVMERNPELEDRANLALNEVKKKKVSESVAPVIEDIESKIDDMMTSSLDRVSKKIKSSQEDYLEEIGRRAQPGTALEFGPTGPGSLPLFPDSYKRFLDNPPEDLSDALTAPEMSIALSNSVDKILDEQGMQLGEQRTMAKSYIINEYGKRKFGEKVLKEVVQDYPDMDGLEKEAKGLVEELDKYNDEAVVKAISPYATEYQKRVNELQQKFDIKADNIAKNIQVQKPEEYNNLVSKYQGKVDSGELSQEEAQSAFNQEFNIMLVNSPELVEIRSEADNVHSMYETSTARIQREMYEDYLSSNKRLKEIGAKNEAYANAIGTAAKDILTKRKDLLDQEWASMVFMDKASRGLVTGVGQTISALGYIVGDNQVGNNLVDVSNQITIDNPMIDVGEFSSSQLTNPDWWATRVLPSAPLTMSMMVPGIGVGSAAVGGLTKVGLSRVAAGLLGGSITGVGMRAFEGSVEAALDYNENIKKGESVEYSSQRAAKIKAKNMNLALLDAAEFATLFLPTTSYAGAFLKFGSQIPMNTVEELYQEGLILEDKAYRDYLKGASTESPEVKYEEVFSGGGVSDIINFAKTPMGKEVGAIGGIYGAAFGAVSLKSDISRARSRRVLNQYISDQLPGISKTENTFNEEMKPLSFGYGAYQRNEFETEKEFVNRRKWQMKATLTEMQNKGQISSEDFASGNEHIDFVFEKISDLPSNLSSEQRLQLLDKLTEIQEAERNMRDVSDDTILAAKKKRIAGLRKEAEQIVNNEAQGYFVDGASLSNKEFKTLLNSPTFLYELARGEHKILINNDAEMEAALGAVSEMVSESDTKEALLAVVESGLAKMSEETTPEGAITWAQAIGEEEIKPEVDEATPAVTPEVTIIEEKIDPVMERVDNEEDININEINEAINILFDEIEKIEKSDLDVNQKRTQMRELLIAADKLDKYENVTETKDVTVTKRTATRVPAEVEGEQTKSPQERIEGRKVRRIEGDEFFADVEVTEDTQKGKTKRPTRGFREEVTVIERDTDGNLILQNYDTKGEKTTAQKLNATSMNDFELVETIKDENDTVIGAVLRNKNDDGQVFAIDDAEIAMDLAIEVTQAELGTVTTEEFEEVIGQVEVKIKKGDKKAAPAEPTKPAPKPAPKVKPATVESLDELGDKINLSTESKEEKNRKYTVVADAQKVLKAIAEILPNVDIVVHETQEEFEAATGSKEEGIFIGKKEFKGVKGTIHINLAKAKAGETVYHEVFHPLILNAVKTSTEANALTTRMVEGVMRASKGNAKVVNALSDWLEAYQGVDRSEEAIAELGAIIGKEYPKLTRSAQNIIKRFINRLANMFGMGDVFRAVNKDADIVAMMNSLVTSLRTGEVITVEDIAGSILEGKIGEPGSIIDSGIKERIEGMNKLKDTSFNTGVEYKNPLNMPAPRTIEDVLESSGGASLFINSDGTGAFLSKDGKKLEGGWRYTYFPLNQEELIGFAATSTTHINTLYNKAQLLTKYRDSKFPNESGKPLSVFVTIQNAETMLGEWYAGDFLMDGINEVINQEKIEGGFEAIKELLINAAEGLVVKKDGELKRIKGVDEFIELVKSDKFNTEEGRNLISMALRSKSYSFKFRVELLKSLIPKSSIAGKNKEIKRALKDAGYGRKEFYRLYTDEVLLEKLEATNFDEKSIGGVTLGGYFMDPSVSREDFLNNRENGIPHAMFNESFSSNGETFVLDGAYHVNDIFPEMSYPSSKGYEAYNEANGTNYTKESAKDDIGVQFEVAKFLLEQKDSFSKNLLIPPFTSIAGSIYTAASEALESDEVVFKERKASPGKKDVLSGVDIIYPTKAQKTERIKLRTNPEYVRRSSKNLVKEDLDKLKKELSGEFGILTSENPMAEPLTESENRKLNVKGKEWLKSKGYSPRNVTGKYEQAENSFFVPNLTMEDAIAFAKEFNQESVAHSEGLVFQDGLMNKRVKSEDDFSFTKYTPKSDFVSVVKSDDGLKTFAVGYDFVNEKTSAPISKERKVKFNAPNQESQPLRDKEGTVIKFRKPRGPLAEALSRASDKVQRASKMTNTQRLKSVEKDLLDFRAQTKRILASHENLSDVSSRFINVLGSPGAAQLMFSEYYEKIYQDLTPTDREFLDVIIAARRIVSINQKRADDNRASVKKLKSDIPQSFFDKGNLGIDAWESVMDDVSSMLATKPFAIDEILDAANTSLESQDVLYTDKITSTQQRKLAKDLKTALKDVLKEENYTGRDAKGKPVGLASARAQMYEIEDQLGAKKFNKLTQRADEYFFAFMELLDDDLKAGLISKEQYDAMAGIEYSPRVFLTYLFNLNDELIKRDPYEVDFQLKTNYSLSGPVIRTLKNGIKDNKASENIFYEFVGDSQLVFSNYLATRQKLRMYNDLNQRTSEELSGLQKRQVELKNKSKLNTEEQNELDVINDVFDNFSLTQKRGFVPNRYMVDGKENFFYIREDVNEQWNNIRPNFGNFASESTVGKVAMWALTTPVSALRTFATGTLAPLFGIGNAAVDAAQVLNFSLAEGYSEFMPAKTVQFLKDLGIVPGMPMETATKSVRTQDALFREAVMEGVMMDYLHTRGREGEPVITQMLDWMAGQVDDVAIVDPAFKGSRKALRKMFDASLYINKQSELAPRMAIYKRVRDHYYAEIKKQNLTSKDQEKARKDARQTAAMYARELMNFAEGGRLTKAANPFMAYLNARFLGFTTPLYGALSSPKNFAKIFSRTLQFSSMSLGATVGLAYWLVSMFMDDEDEKEGKKPIDIIRETREQASPYIRQKYYLIPMGLKDEEGNYKSIRIKKNPSLVPALEMGEMYIDNLLEGKSAKDALPELNLQYAAKINHAVFDNFLPMNVSFWDEKGNTRGLEMASEILNGNPLMSGTVEMVTGYDLYRNRPIKKKYFNEMNISEAYLGYADDRVQPFYKSISMLMKKKGVMDVSPYNIQHFSQKMITTPENNPYVYTAYSMLNKASGTDAYEAKDKTFMENIMKGVSKKVIYSSRYRPGIENKNFSELNNELQNNLDKDYLIKQELNKVADKAAKEGGFGLLLSKEENVEKVLKAKDEFFSKLEGYGFEVNDKDRDIYISELAEKVINNYAGVEESNNRKLKDIIYLGVGERKDRNMALAFWMAYPQLDYDSKKPITKQSEEFLETISNLSETYAQVKGQKKPKLPDSFYLELISVYKEYEIGKDTKGK